jgi:hypothetical protein
MVIGTPSEPLNIQTIQLKNTLEVYNPRYSRTGQQGQRPRFWESSTAVGGMRGVRNENTTLRSSGCRIIDARRRASW